MLARLRELLPLMISAIFVVLAGIILVYGKPEDRPMAIATGAFFGLGLGVLGASAWYERRSRQHRAARGVVEIVGGVSIPRRRGPAIAGALAIITVGGLFAWAFGARAWLPLVLGGALVVLGGWLLVMAFLGKLSGALRFEPEGIVVREAGSEYTVPWDAIVSISLVSLHGWPAVALQLRSLEPLVSSAAPATARRAVERRLVTAVAWVGAPILIVAHYYGLDAGQLAKAIALYVGAPEARTRLRRSPELPQPAA